MPKRCEACGGCGVLFGASDVNTIERCDACARFKTDQAAIDDVEKLYQGINNLIRIHDENVAKA